MTGERALKCGIAMAVAVGLAIPTGASAAVYCVHQPADAFCAAGEIDKGTNLQGALNDADASGVFDQVRVGAGTYPGPFTYPAAGGAVQITGVGPGTILNAPTANGTTVLDVDGPGSRVENLHIDVPLGNSTMQNRGLDTESTTAGVEVLIPATPTFDMLGVVMNNGQFVNGSVLGPMPASGLGFNVVGIVASGESLITGSTIRSDEAIDGVGSTTIRRVDAQGRVGFDLQGEPTAGPDGVFLVEDSVWRSQPGAVDPPFGLFPGCGTVDAQVTARNLTLINEAANGTTAFSICNVAGRTATVDLSSSIALGGMNSLRASTGNATATATLNVSYSDYNPATVTATGTGTSVVNQGAGNVNVTPGFVSPTDPHLTSASPLLDIGDPAAPGAMELDIDGGQRGLSALISCTSPDVGRRDIGADEFVVTSRRDCTAPDTGIAGKSKLKTKKKKAKGSFDLSSPEAGVSYECSVDGGAFSPCTDPFTTKLRRGAHTVAARAKDAAGNVDPTPAVKDVKVKRKKS